MATGLLLDLPPDLLAEIVQLAFAADVAAFWILSRVCRALKAAVEAAAARATSLGGDAASAVLRRRPKNLLEPAVPLGRLLSHMPLLETLDLSGSYWWISTPEAYAAVAAAPAAARLRVLRLDHCEKLDDAALLRLLSRRRAEGEGEGEGEGDGEGASAAFIYDALFAESRRAPSVLRARAEDVAAGKFVPREPRLAMPLLRELSLRSCRGLRSADFVKLLCARAARAPLERLDVGWCASLGGLDRWLRFAGRLRFLDATGLETPPADAVCDALPRSIEEVVLATTGVSDRGLMALASAQRLPALRRVVLSRRADNLWEDGRWTLAGVAELKRRRPGLSIEFV